MDPLGFTAFLSGSSRCPRSRQVVSLTCPRQPATLVGIASKVAPSWDTKRKQPSWCPKGWILSFAFEQPSLRNIMFQSHHLAGFYTIRVSNWSSRLSTINTEPEHIAGPTGTRWALGVCTYKPLVGFSAPHLFLGTPWPPNPPGLAILCSPWRDASASSEWISGITATGPQGETDPILQAKAACS